MTAAPREDKESSLRRDHALNPRPQAVRDPAFTSGNLFFDPRDVVQVKYEMLRRVRQEGEPVSQVAADFGFSRPSFYQARRFSSRRACLAWSRSDQDRSGRTSSPKRCSPSVRSGCGPIPTCRTDAAGPRWNDSTWSQSVGCGIEGSMSAC